MKKLPAILAQLSRPEVVELAVTSGKRPRVRVGDTFEPAGHAALDVDAVFELLIAAGGSRYIEDLSARPTQWRTRLEGIGVVSVSAVMRGVDVEATLVPPPREGAKAHEATAGGGAGHAARAPTKRPRAHTPVPATGNPRGRTTAAPRGRSSSTANRKASHAPPRRPPSEPRLSVEPITLELEGPTRPLRSAAQTQPSFRSAAGAERALAGGRQAPAVRDVGAAGPALTRLLLAGRHEHASDVHVVAGRPPLLRVRGVLAPAGQALAADAVEAMLLEIVPPRLAAALEEEGSCDFALETPAAGRFRVNVSRQRTGMMGSFRLVAPAIPTLASLGLPEEIGLATRHHQGLIVVTGPTGHGKTCTLAAIVDLLNAGTRHHVITVEDPVEHVHPRKQAMMSQREVGTHTRSFAAALKASLREDPDVIVVGELRDTETVRMALSASETGHLVLGTMNTPSAAKTIDRLIDLFPPADQAQVRATLAGGLRLVVSQRLVPSADGSRMLPAVELLPGSLPLWNLIRDNKTFQIPSLQQRGKALGIVRLNDSLADRVRSGQVTAAAALAAAAAPAELDELLGGRRAPPAVAVHPAPSAELSAAPRGLFQMAGSFFGKKGS